MNTTPPTFDKRDPLLLESQLSEEERLIRDSVHEFAQDRLMPLHKAIFTEPGLVGVKYAMSRLDLCSDEVRLPLTELTDPTKELVDAGLRHAGVMN